MPLLRLDLPATLASIADARDGLEPLRAEVGTDRWQDLRLLVSEVVTNAVRHTRTAPDARVVLIADRCTDGVRVEVHDEGDGFKLAAASRPVTSGTSGWGLFLVAELASRWGTQPAPGAHVWFELNTRRAG